MKIAAISINRKLLEGNMVTISDNSQERFSFLSRCWYPVSFLAILPRENQGGNHAGIYVDREANNLLFLMAYHW